MHNFGLIDSALSSGTLLAEIIAVKNRTFILDHFRGISLMGSNGGLMSTGSTVSSFHVKKSMNWWGEVF